MTNERIDVLAVMADSAQELRAKGPREVSTFARELTEARAAVAELIEAARKVAMIPSPVGTGYDYGTPEDRAYTEGFMHALRLVREPGFACGLDAALARVQGGA